MIEVRIDLNQFGLGINRRGLGIMGISNDGTGTPSRGNYDVVIQDDRGRKYRRGRIENWARQSRPVWQLVKEAFNSL